MRLLLSLANGIFGRAEFLTRPIQTDLATFPMTSRTCQHGMYAEALHARLR